MTETTAPRMNNIPGRRRSVVLTSHPRNATGQTLKVHWGVADPATRGPIVGTLENPGERNAIGTHAGAYSLYRALAVAAGQLDPQHKPDLTDTAPAAKIGPFPQWFDPDLIVSLDPWGHLGTQEFSGLMDKGWDIRPTIAVTKARINMPEIRDAIAAGRLVADGDILTEAEWENLVFAGKLMTYEVGIRFLADYLQGDIYFKTKRPGHNLDRARNQLRLVDRIEAAADAMSAIVVQNRVPGENIKSAKRII